MKWETTHRERSDVAFLLQLISQGKIGKKAKTEKENIVTLKLKCAVWMQQRRTTDSRAQQIPHCHDGFPPSIEDET